MKALTVRQPWASLIAAGVKTIETRSRRTSHRGPLVIHAGLAKPPSCKVCGGSGIIGVGSIHDGSLAASECPDCVGNGIRQFNRSFDPLHERLADEELPLGAIVACGDLVDCVPITASAENGRRTVGRVNVPLPDGGSRWQLWDDDGYGCVSIGDQLPYGDFTPGRWAWLLANVRPLAEPVPARGAQGLWNLPADVEVAVTAQLAEAVVS